MENIKEYLEHNPGSVIFTRYAAGLADAGRLNEAIEILKKGARANPFHATGHAVLGEMLFRKGETEQAAEAVRTSLTIDPQRPADLVRLGRYLAGDSPEEALMCLDKALRYAPENQDIRSLADQLREQLEPDMDLRLSERTEQALRGIAGEETQPFAQPIPETPEEDMLAELAAGMSDEASPVETEESVDQEDVTAARPGLDGGVAFEEEFTLADEDEAAAVQDEDATGGRDEASADLAETGESVRRTEEEVSDAIDEAKEQSMDSAGVPTASEPAVSSDEQEQPEDIRPTEDAEAGMSEGEEPVITSSGEAIHAIQSVEAETGEADATISGEGIPASGPDTDEERQTEEPAADDSAVKTGETEAATGEGDKGDGLGDDITEDFLAYAQMIEAESSGDESSTYDKLITEHYGDGEEAKEEGDSEQAAQAGIEEGWKRVISGEATTENIGESGAGTSDDELTQELMDYVRLFDAGDDASPDAGDEGDTTVIGIDETGEYDPSSFDYGGTAGDAVLSDEERQSLERGETIGETEGATSGYTPRPDEETTNAAAAEEDLSSLAGDLSTEELKELGRPDAGQPSDEELRLETEETLTGEYAGAGDYVGSSEEPDAAPGEAVPAFEEQQEREKTGAEEARDDNIEPIAAPDEASGETDGRAVEELSIDDLINDYMSSLNAEATLDQQSSEQSAGIESAASGPGAARTAAPGPVQPKSAERLSGGDGGDGEEITATIAEIYVAQGLISKAIGIYEKLLARDPSNEAVRSRLTGLQQQLERQSEES